MKHIVYMTHTHTEKKSSLSLAFCAPASQSIQIIFYMHHMRRHISKCIMVFYAKLNTKYSKYFRHCKTQTQKCRKNIIIIWIFVPLLHQNLIDSEINFVFCLMWMCFSCVPFCVSCTVSSNEYSIYDDIIEIFCNILIFGLAFFFLCVGNQTKWKFQNDWSVYVFK